MIISIGYFHAVPSENKKDVRSIEQTMADIQAKKRLKTAHTNESAPFEGPAAIATAISALPQPQQPSTSETTTTTTQQVDDQLDDP